jgi:nitrogen fixation/metabolism regulation signal transduction histidine kinase
MTTSLLRHSLEYATTKELDEVSRLLEATGRAYYQQAREALRADAAAGRLRGETARKPYEPEVREFLESGESERFVPGEEIRLLRRAGDEVKIYRRPLPGPGMDLIAAQYARARAIVESGRSRNLRRGFTYTYLVLSAGIWLGALGLLVFIAGRISRPIQALTSGLQRVAAGDLAVRVEPAGSGEVASAIAAFNRMADELQASRERLLYLTRVAGWQNLARKMAHEVKNSLTPIRLTMEEINARFSDAFLKQASQIVVEEVGALERRVRAFSEFAAEPAVHLEPVTAGTLIEERVAFLSSAHPGVRYEVRIDSDFPPVHADADLLRAILTNLLENAAQAAGEGGTVMVIARGDPPVIEIHDSGPGLSAEARATLFEPTISDKKDGMGLGLSIARRSALLMGGDIVLIKGELGGAGFRVTLKKA